MTIISNCHIGCLRNLLSDKQICKILRFIELCCSFFHLNSYHLWYCAALLLNIIVLVERVSPFRPKCRHSLDVTDILGLQTYPGLATDIIINNYHNSIILQGCGHVFLKQRKLIVLTKE